LNFQATQVLRYIEGFWQWGKGVDWKEKTLAYWTRINAQTVRRFGPGPLAEEAALAVIDGLAADNWQRVRAFGGQASFSTFILTVSARLAEDFARKRFGRVRPPLWLQTFGGFWLKLFQLLCVERSGLSDAVERVAQQDLAEEKAAIETAAYELLARIPDCGMERGREVVFVEEEGPLDVISATGPADTMEGCQRREVFQAVFQLVVGQEQRTVDEALLKKYQELKISLQPEEKLLLKLCYQDGLAVTEAGAMLGMNRFQVHGKLRRLLKKLQTTFEQCGLAEALRPLLES
jgi:RNA polymerase sigma factor (sigma-70 family)